jgi:penicillin-binding protein 1A
MNKVRAWWQRLGTKQKILTSFLVTFSVCFLLVALIFTYIMLVVYPQLPSLDNIRDYRPKLALKVYSQEGILLGEYGEERRTFVPIQEIPDLMKKAVIAIEDERFYQHAGLDFFGIGRALIANLVGHRQGASTITQQVARNFYLTNEQTFTRKFYEALLAVKIESELTKDQILELYMNQIFLGQRAYGFAAAAQNYFSKDLSQLSVAEMAMLAGLPKAPSMYNPVVNPKRAKTRQMYILQRMFELGFIDQSTYEKSKSETLQVKQNQNSFKVKADFVAEMARQFAYDLYREDAYSMGISIYTTVRADEQNAAYMAVRQSLLSYEKRHAYRGPEKYIELSADGDNKSLIEEVFSKHQDLDDIKTAIVLDASPKEVKAELQSGEVIVINGAGLDLIKSALKKDAQTGIKVVRGAVIRLRLNDKKLYEVVQIPELESAFISLNSADGAIRSLVGGFDFQSRKFNHVTQAWRQPGSTIKPFIYAAAFDRGFMPTTLVNDAPISINSEETGNQLWEPKNYGGDYDGPITIREALAKSKNMVTVRVIREMTASVARDYLLRFGFDSDKTPNYLTLALGASSVTPLQMARAYAVFANEGYLIEPYLIDRVVDQSGRVLYQHQPKLKGDESNRVIDARNAFVTNSVLQEVVRKGTAAKANSLNFPGLAGKTGTTNDSVDVWFAGYHPDVVGVAWVGYDTPKSLGDRETGGGLALPIWIDYMKVLLPKLPEIHSEMPAEVVQIGRDFYYSEFTPGLGIKGVDVGEAGYVDKAEKTDAQPSNQAASSAPVVRSSGALPVKGVVSSTASSAANKNHP